jgi:chloramphenicol 3-O phosphotransferase
MIVILNGASSSGKTALARALQQQWTGPLLLLGTDAMMAMLPAAYVGMKPTASRGIEFVNEADEHGPLVRARRGDFACKLEDDFARAVASLAKDGHDLVLDLVLFDPASIDSYLRAFEGLRTCFVGVRCSLAVLEARELARGDRFPNLARSQHAAVHTHSEFYDLEVDSTEAGSQELADRIVRYLHANPSPDAFGRLARQVSGDGSRTVASRGVKVLERLLSTDEVRVSRLVLAPGEEVPWHFHSNLSDTFYVLRGPVTIHTRDPETTAVIERGEIFRTRERQPHRVVNASDGAVSFVLIQGFGDYDFCEPPV